MTSRHSTKRTQVLLCSLALCVSFAASAVPVTWELSANYATFEATGTFVYDADLGGSGFSAIAINLTGPGGPFALDTFAASCGVFGPSSFTFATDAVCSGPAIQVFELLVPMTNAGGFISIAQADVTVQSVACNVNCVDLGYAADGSYIRSAVPEPGTLSMVGAFLLGLGYLRRRRGKAA